MSDQEQMATTGEALDAAADGNRRVIGRVTSNKANKTITVMLERYVKHPIYGKFMRRRTKIHAHDEDNSCQEGDVVMVEQCRPLSKTKTWRFVKLIERPS